MNSRQTPLGFVPLNTESVPPYGPAGAGAGRMSAASTMSVGRNMPAPPATTGISVASGSDAAAASSNVSVMPATSSPPPQSDMSTQVWPAGPTSTTSRSSGNVWLRPLRRTVTLATGLVTPRTAIPDGYGLAGPEVA